MPHQIGSSGGLGINIRRKALGVARARSEEDMQAWGCGIKEEGCEQPSCPERKQIRGCRS